ncbi:hypothetical protein NL108_013006 [Boleophthalmus pectinirostris]|uniref:amphoterin-induced protein 3-like n=1 Tax=Boleophthalmus pectinirostris TaxID=150288 RepID=UPI000A1C2D27|nr:amphoterin-induced protein 3-like [Boleophthalmus pectinirostris]KAJ0064758.1 hypothetical protein NL108_013006 [Boleophthalmus pectinirostris]
MPAHMANGSCFLVFLCLVCSCDGTCPNMCLCLSDTVSCSSAGFTKFPTVLPTFSITVDLSHNYLSYLGAGSFEKMPRLENLCLAHNQLTSLGEGVFQNASGLRFLDLSSNKLHLVEQHYFHGLWRLEELLLFNNKITQVESGMLNGLSSLKKLYLSLNQLTNFPFFTIQDHTHPFLTMLDLSSNRLNNLPWEDIKALPSLVQRGLYLHNNSLTCNCAMYSMFWHWQLRNYETLKDFTDDHRCLIYGEMRATIKFLHHTRFFHNCTLEKAVSLPVTVYLSTVLVTEEDTISLDCQTSIKSTELSYTWLTPSKGYLTPATKNSSLITIFPNGTLEMQSVKVNDSGLYVCTAVSVKLGVNATREVNVTVSLPPPESFNTGYTTLLGCAITMILILMYLYLTPCRCSCCKQPKPPSVTTYDPSSLSSVFSSSIRENKPYNDKHVAFLEPMMSPEVSEEWTQES